MTDDSPQRHDHLFKLTFTRKDAAVVELRTLLPVALVEQLDWETLTVEATELYIDDEKEVRCDILYGVSTRSGKTLQLYLLLEHQSRTDATMPQRLLGYMAAKYAELIKNKVALPWPVILPMVVHHSRSGWAASTSYQDLFDKEVLNIPGVREAVPDFRFFLDDISQATDEELLLRAQTAAEQIVPLTLWALRDGRSEENLRESFARWAPQFAELWRTSEARTLLSAVFGYLASRGLTLQTIEEGVREASASTKDAIMTLAEQLEQRGELRGRAEGRRAVLERLLTLKYGSVSAAVQAKLAAADLAQLDELSERILTADSIEDLFA